MTKSKLHRGDSSGRSNGISLKASATGSVAGWASSRSDARSKLLIARPAKTSSLPSSRSSNAFAREENNSNTPTNSSPRSKGITMTERIPRRLEASTSARASSVTSLHRWICLVLMHAPERPDEVLSLDPKSGAVEPLLARQIISPSRCKTMAAPVAPVAMQACSTISLSTISSARSAESSGDNPPPLCAAKRAARSAKSVSKLASSACALRAPVAE